MFTASAAYAAFEEKDKGSIEIGKLADLTVLSKDIMKIPEPEILTTTCAMTVNSGAQRGKTRPTVADVVGVLPLRPFFDWLV